MPVMPNGGAPDLESAAPRRLSAAALQEGDQVAGFVLDRDDPAKRFVVELWLDGFPVRLARAQIYDHALHGMGHGDGCYGFAFSLLGDLADAHIAEVRLANSGDRVGDPVLLERGVPDRPDGTGGGWVAWTGGLRLSGWVPVGETADAERITAWVDGRCVADTEASGWAHRAIGGEAIPTRAFVLHLPPVFADGRVRRARICGPDGSDLPGSPCAVVAFEDGLAGFLARQNGLESERIRGDLTDRLVPQSLPFSAWEAWLRRFPQPEPSPVEGPVAVVLIGGDGADRTIASLRQQKGCDWVAAVLPNRDGPTTFDGTDLAAFLDGDAEDCAVVVLCIAGATLMPSAVVRLAAALQDRPGAAVSYCDILLEGDDGTVWPVFYTAFDHERALEQGCGAYLFGIRRALLRDPAASDLFGAFATGFRAFEPSSVPPVHVPGALGTLRPPAPAAVVDHLADAMRRHLEPREGETTVVARANALFPAVRVLRRGPSRSVSILMPLRHAMDAPDAVAAWLDETTQRHHVELVLIGPDTDIPAAPSFPVGVKILRVPGVFNRSDVLNKGARVSEADLLLVLEPGTRPLGRDWLDEMVGRLDQDDVGVVGPLLTEVGGVVRSGGMVLGPGFDAVPCFSDRLVGDGGYGDLLQVAHECSAVPLNGLLTHRRLFDQVAGFDAVRFPVHYASVDYCLQLRARGYRVLFTPDARFECGAPVVFDPPWAETGEPLRARERSCLRLKWGEALADDPYYHPFLSRDGAPYGGLAWPPREAFRRRPQAAQPFNVPVGF